MYVFLFLIKPCGGGGVAGAGPGWAGLDLGWAGLAQSGIRMHPICFMLRESVMITSFVVNFWAHDLWRSDMLYGLYPLV